MTNRKNDEKLEVPKWFKLTNYDGLASLTTPLDWLLQFAFRIDLRNFWGEISNGHTNRLTADDSHFVGDSAFKEIFLLIQKRPILPVDKLVSQFGAAIDFPTVSLAKRGLAPVRPMSFTDILLIYASLPSEKRKLVRHVIDCIERDAPYPLNALRFAQNYMAEDRFRKSRRKQVSDEFETISRYRKTVLGRVSQLKQHDSQVHVLNSILSSGWDDAAGDFLNDPLFDHTSREFTSYFALDANTPIPLAKDSLERHIRNSKPCSNNGKVVGKRLFKSWRRNGILPYIDLNFYAEYEAFVRDVQKAAISDDALANAIFPGTDDSGDAKKVSGSTRPTAEALMDSESSLFRQLLNAIRN